MAHREKRTVRGASSYLHELGLNLVVGGQLSAFPEFSGQGQLNHKFMRGGLVGQN